MIFNQCLSLGTKSDLREDLAAQRSMSAENKSFVSRKEAIKVAKKIKVIGPAILTSYIVSGS